MDRDILEFQKECFSNYLADIRKIIPDIPNPYVFPDGNPIQPVVPVKTTRNSIMIIGAFPSARFERRNKVLIPIGNNLSPFGEEEYFDGCEVRTQASRDSLNKNYFEQLNIVENKIWLTDIVKIYLYPDKHICNCEFINPNIKYANTHKLFLKIAKASMEWMRREISLCDPKLIITLGEIPANVISGNYKTISKELLNGIVKPLILDKEYKIAHLAHPEIRRRNKEWDNYTIEAIKTLADYINNYL